MSCYDSTVSASCGLGLEVGLGSQSHQVEQCDAITHCGFARCSVESQSGAPMNGGNALGHGAVEMRKSG